MSHPLPDIQSRQDIELLINSFYERVKKDELIGPIFTQHVPVFWDIHLPIMYEFWSGVLLHEGNYGGGMIRKHLAVDRQFPLKPEHFDRWKAIFLENLDAQFQGDIAQEAKKRVEIVSQVLQVKIKASRNPGFIQ